MWRCILLFLAFELTAQVVPTHPDLVRNQYVLGSGDQVTVIATEPEEIAGKIARVEVDGFLRFPLVGKIFAAGLTTEQVEKDLNARLKTWVHQPEITLAVTDFRSQRVSVVGSVANPGVQVLQGPKTIVEVLAQAGGLRPDAGYSLRLTRRIERGRIPLPGATDDPTGKFSISQLDATALLASASPKDNIFMEPDDVLTVPRGEMVYLIGEVRRAGGYVLRENETVPVLQAISLAEGLTPGASAKKARILRQLPGSTTRKEIPVDVKKILSGKGADVMLQANDILFVPGSTLKIISGRAAEAALSIGTGLAIYRP